MTISPAGLRAIASVVRLGGLRPAAAELQLSESAISQTIKAVERLHGVELFTRTGRRLAPTAIGCSIAELGEHWLVLEARARSILARREDTAQAELRIGLGNAMPGMAIIRQFRERYAVITTTIQMGNFDQVLEGVLQGALDVALLPAAVNHPLLRTRACMAQSIVAIVPSGHRLAGRKSLRLDELGAEPLILRTKGSATRRVVEKAFKQAALALHPALELATREGVFEAVANGLGIGFIWQHSTSRRDGFARASLPELRHTHDESALCLASNTSPVVDAFMVHAQLLGEISETTDSPVPGR